MTDWKKWRGLRALVEDAVEHGSRAVERVHMGVAARPFAILEHIPGVAAPSRLVHAVHDVTVAATYTAIRVVNRGVGAAVELGLAAAESGAVVTPPLAPDAPPAAPEPPPADSGSR